MSEPQQQPVQRVEIEVDPAVEPGVHADFVSIWHTPDTFVLDFASLRQAPILTQDPDGGPPVVVVPTRIVARVKIPPAQVFELMKGLNQQLTVWERETGKSGPPPEGVSGS